MSGYGGRGRGRGGGGGGRGGKFPGGRDEQGGGHFQGGPRQQRPVPVVAVPPGPVPDPDTTVTKIENALLSGKGAPNIGGLKLEDSTLPTRPGYGTRGRAVVLWANYVGFSTPASLTLYRYDIAITPTVVGRKLNQVVRLLLEAPELASAKGDMVSDFKTTLISRTKLPDQTITIPYRSEGEDEPREDATRFQVQLNFTNALATSDLTQYLTSTDLSATYNDKLPMIQAFNIFLNHYSKSAGNLATIGSSKVFSMSGSPDTFDLGGCLTAVRGFFASVRAATGRVLVNVNVSHGAFYQEGPLDGMVSRLAAPQRLFPKLEAFLKGIRVKTTHLPERRNRKGEVVVRAKTIYGLANKNDGTDQAHPPRVKSFGAGPRDVEFWLETSGSSSQPAQPASSGQGKKKKKGGKGGGGGGGGGGGAQPVKSGTAGGRYISVYDFFVNSYGIRIADTDLPVVNLGNRSNPTYLPMEVCRILRGQPANKKLDPNQTQQMIRFAVRRPVDNFSSIVTKGISTAGLSSNTNPLLASFGITASNSLITVQGRVIPGPRVVYKQKKEAQVMAGGWNMMGSGSGKLKFEAAGSVKNWSCLYIEMPNTRGAWNFTSDQLKPLVANFHRILVDAGVAASPPQAARKIQLNGTDDRPLENFMMQASANLQLLLIILPTGSMPLYSRIKQLGDVKYGIHTVCAVGSKIAKERGQDQYFRNVALKFNLKLGGSNHLVDSRDLGLISEDKTMVVGIDVTHPSPGSAATAPSIAGMVASVDSQLGQWPGTLSIQAQQRQEIVSDLKDMLKSRLSLWRGKHKGVALPDNILVYRDGVSEGQYQQIIDDEVPLLRAACKDLYPAKDQARGLPRLTVIVVGKRHHTRFYPTTVSDADRSGNTKPGTVVDRGVTEARTWDFFLQAHTALQGTARPAHYVVLVDEIFRSRRPAGSVADDLVSLTQSMCYAFGRATKAVSYCTPAYYADILCERARCYLSSVFDTPAGSVAGSSVAGPGPGPGTMEQDVRVHERLKNTMFYI